MKLLISLFLLTLTPLFAQQPVESLTEAQKNVMRNSMGLTKRFSGGTSAELVALIAGASAGQEITIAAGSWTGPFVVSAAGVKLKGEPGTKLLAALATSNVLTISAADVAIEDIEIDGRYASQSNSGGQANQCGIYLSAGADRLRLTRVYIHDTCGHGVSNVTGCNDGLIENCRIINGGTAASAVQATPSPTTTTFAVAPGTAGKFAAGQVLRIGSQSSTISSIISKNSAVASVTSNTIFVVNAGDGALFTGGDVIRIGSQSGTISTVVSNTITLTGALSTTPIVGQIVGIDKITLTSAITAPTAGHVVAPVGGYLKGIYCTASSGWIIRHSTLRGWSQAIGLWYGARRALIDGNNITDNYGYEDTSHTVNRSAVELFPNNVVGGENRVIGNNVDGSTHNCFEIVQGEVGSVLMANTVRNWAPEVGLGATGFAIEFGGTTGIPGLNTDNSAVANCIYSNGANQSTGIAHGSYSSRIKISGNTFTGFSHPTNPYPIILQGDGSVSVTNNSFAYCTRAIFVNGTTARGVITGNLISSFPPVSNAIELFAAGDGWIISNNSVDGDITVNGGSGIVIASTGGNRHRITSNTAKVNDPIKVSTADNLIMGNHVEKNINNGTGAIGVTSSTALRNQIKNNSIINGGGYAVRFQSSADYNVAQDNQVSGALGDINNAGGTHNLIEPNSYGNTVSPVALKSLGSQTVGTSQATIAHGLGYAPTVVTVTMTSAGNIYRSATSDATNIYLTADSSGRTADVFVR